MFLLAIRVFKEALRSGGGQLTPKHIEDVSMAVFFLLEASKKADQAFSVAPQATAHTTVDSRKDVTLMSKRLIESAITTLDTERQTPPFVDPACNHRLEEIDNHNLAPRYHPKVSYTCRPRG